jgi:hypothetical protein
MYYINEQHRNLQPYDVVIIEKHAIYSIRLSECVVFDFNEKSIFNIERRTPFT